MSDSESSGNEENRSSTSRMSGMNRRKLTNYHDCLRKIQPAKVSRGRVVKIPVFGTEFSINVVRKDGELKTVPIIPGNRPNKFLALFESDDVDFEIGINNREAWSRHVSSTFDIHNKRHAICVPKSSSLQIKALETKGRKLHFLRKSSEEGDTFIATFAAKKGLSFKKASHILSQIKVEVGYSNPVSKDSMMVDVNDFIQKFRLVAVPTITVGELKRNIEEFWGIVVLEQRLIFKGRVLSDMKTLADYEIQEGNEIHMIRGLEGGSCTSTTSEDELTSEPYSDSDSTVLLPESSRSNLGERGVIVLGDQSDERFLPIEFHDDEELGISRFVIELRRKTQFGFNC